MSQANDLTLQSMTYSQLVKNLSSVIEEGRKIAVRQINTVLIATYWLIGTRVVEYEQSGKVRAHYGEETLKKLAQELTKKYGNGFGFANLKNIRQFYLTYRQTGFAPSSQRALEKGYALRSQFPYLLREISAQFQLSWTHYRFLMRIEKHEKKAFYENLSIQNHWSSRQLEREVSSLLYERTALSKRKDLVLAKANENAIVLRPEDEIKDPYVLDFLGLKDEYSESELEDALIQHLEKFLLELGAGFAFVARQKRFIVGGNHYRIDLLLFHRILKCLVLIDLKIGDFNHGDAGQMNFYLNWAKNEARLPGENNPVGIVLCSGKNQAYVEYALGNMSNKIFVSQYKLKLPKSQDLKRELEKVRAGFLEHRTVNERTLDEKIKDGKE